MRNGIALLITSLTFSIAACTLQGCMDVAVTGAQVFYDRHNLNKKLQNFSIAIQANQLINKQYYSLFKNTRISVASFNYDVLLLGQVANAKQRREAQIITQSIPGIEHLFNKISVQPPIPLARQMQDSWITTKIKTKLIANNDISPDQFKVITEDGIVYLMGHVLPEQASIAIEIAQQTEGVDKVVSLFRYFKLEK